MTSQNAGDTTEREFDYGRAIAEASRCLLCHDAPCSAACPAGTDPATFLRKLRLKNLKGAVRIAKQNNILAGACGALCPTSRLCEQACCAAGLDRPIRIGKVQQFLVEQSWKFGFQPLQRCEPRKGKVAVVGSGPAGLSCAASLAAQGCKVTIFEARSTPGGVLAWGVPTWRLPPHKLEKEIDDVRYLGVEIRCQSPLTSRAEAESLLSKGYQAVFLAPGCWEPVRLKGEPVVGVLTSTALLSALREGNDQEPSKTIANKTVAVLGGGSVAMDCVEACRRLGAKEVYLVYRRSFQQMPAEEDERLLALRTGIHFLLLNQPLGYECSASGQLTGLKLLRTRLGEPDSKGRRQPVEVPGSEWILPVEAVVEALGSSPAIDSPNWYPSVEVDRGRLIQVQPDTGRTSVPGIFAGGDIVAGPALVVTAIRDGKRAAQAILAYLAQGGAR